MSLDNSGTNPDSQIAEADNESTSPEFVVGIGASAGGLEALEVFFREMPSDTGLAFVVVQHLSPDFKSVMDDLLARVTEIPIRMIENDMRLEANTIYLIPPNQELICSGCKLLLTDRSAGRELNFPIDQFFRSLADDLREKAIAIVLSGTGTDGSRGICDIHEAGGLVLSQTPESAKFDGMPKAARDTGIVNVLLRPVEMPGALLEYLNDPNRELTAASREALVVMEGPMFTIFHLLKKHCGVDFSDYKTTTISRRIHRRVMLNGISDLESYVDILKQNPEEVDRLYKDLLIGVTAFFRDQDVFERLELDVIPELMERLDQEEEFRAWVVATATGEEAYSLAIIIAEYLESQGDSRPVKIFATDVHQDSLDKASRGVYPEQFLAGVTPQRLQKYFVRHADGYHLIPAIRKMVVFVSHNVIRDAPFTKLDLVTCRNVLIYLSAATQKKVLSLLHFALKREAALCLGPSETLGDLTNEFSTVDERTKIFRKHRDVLLPASMRMPVRSPVVPLPVNREDAMLPALSRSIDSRELMSTYDQILDELMPASLLIGPNREFLQSFSGASQYLQARDGRASTDILDVIHEDLRSPLSTALRRLNGQGKPVVYNGVRCESTEGESNLKLTLRPLASKTQARPNVLVVIEASDLPGEEADVIDATATSSEQVEVLERELQETRDNLQSTIEHSQTTNEELQSANEQLIASNEELQSTNEELHSVNEELYTVNAEHQRKIGELTELTDDMDNLLASTNVHTIFLDAELKIRRMTPGIADTFNLIPQDVGRRIDTFTYNLLDKDLVFRVKQVLDSEAPFQREVRDRNDNWYLLRILPYRSGGRVEGVVLTLIEITSLKLAERKLAEVSEIVEQSDDAILRLTRDGTVTMWNRGAEKLFGFKADDITGRNVSMIVPPDRQDEAADILSRNINGETVDHFETQRVCRDGRKIDVALTLSPIRDVSGTVVGASEIVRDITHRKQLEVRMLEEIERRDQFLAMLSHELRNPLGALLNASHMLNESDKSYDGDGEHPHQIIQRQVEHMAALLNDLLDVNRISQGQIRLQRKVVDLVGLIQPATETIRPQLEANEQQLELTLPDSPVWIDASAERIQQILVNLLANASRYSPAGETISLSIGRMEDRAVLTVSDNGMGIRPELIDDIFDLFVQGDQSIDRSEGGMGVGLALVKRLIELHGGKVYAKSAGPGQGSEFVIELPISPPPRIQKPDSSPDVAQLPARRILLIEDNDDAREMMVAILEMRGFEVIDAADGRTGLELVKSSRPDVAILDIGLPELDGYEVARRIRADHDIGPIRLIALTGYGQDEDKRNALDAGFDDHLTKPLSPAKLIEILNESSAGRPDLVSR